MIFYEISGLNIRLSPAIDERLSKSAEMAGVNKTEYVRKLIERDSDYVTGDEVAARVKRFISKLTPVQREGGFRCVQACQSAETDGYHVKPHHLDSSIVIPFVSAILGSREEKPPTGAAAFLPLRRGAKRLATLPLELATLRVVAAVWRPPLRLPPA
jgi:predicted DNA-binding protein